MIRLPRLASLHQGAAASRRLASAGLMAAALLMPAAASATVVVGTFDPAFGVAIPNLGFRGTVSVQVPAACFALTPGLILNSNACSGGGMLVLSSTVEFYNVLQTGQPTIGTQGFSFGAADLLSIVTGAGPTLPGVNTELSGAQTLSLFDAGPDNAVGTADDVDYTGSFKLRFRAIDPQEQGPTGPYYYAEMLAQCTPGAPPACTNGEPQLSNPAFTQFGAVTLTVPEPGGLALVMAALAAAFSAGALRRRG